MKNLAAAKAIAVSFTGVSEQAHITAAHYGIEIRTVSEMDPIEFTDWIKIKKIENTIYFSEYTGSVEHKMYPVDGETGGMMHPDVISEIAEKQGNAKVYGLEPGKPTISLNDIFNSKLKEELGLFNDIPTDGTQVKKPVKIKIKDKLVGMKTEEGWRFVGEIIFDVIVSAKVEIIQIDSPPFLYSGPNMEPVYGVEAKSNVLGNDLVFSLHRQKGSEALILTVSKEQEKNKGKSKRKKAK